MTEVLRLLVTLRLQHALQEYFFVFFAGRLELCTRWTDGVVNRLEYSIQPPVKTVVALAHYL